MKDRNGVSDNIEVKRSLHSLWMENFKCDTHDKYYYNFYYEGRIRKSYK